MRSCRNVTAISYPACDLLADASVGLPQGSLRRFADRVSWHQPKSWRFSPTINPWWKWSMANSRGLQWRRACKSSQWNANRDITNQATLLRKSAYDTQNSFLAFGNKLVAVQLQVAPNQSWSITSHLEEMHNKYPFTQVQLVTWICPKIGDSQLYPFNILYPGLLTETEIFGDYATPCDPAWRGTNLFLEGRLQLKGASVWHLNTFLLNFATESLLPACKLGGLSWLHWQRHCT